MNAQSANDAKLQGIDQVMSNNNNWKERGHDLLIEALKGKSHVTGEELRVALIGCGLWKPTHHNAWGGFMHGLVGKVLDSTGQLTPMKLTESHARKTMVYTVRPIADWELE